MILRVIVDTAIGQHAHRNSVWVIGIGPEIGVVVAHQRVRHCTIGVGLVGVFRGVVLRGGGHTLHSTEQVQFQSLNGLVGEDALHLELVGVQVDVVLFQLVENVERVVVAGVVFIGVEHTRGVQCIAIGVDVEGAAYLTTDEVHLTRQRARCLLLTGRGVGVHLQLYFLREVERRAEVGGVALHLALLVPSGIEHARYRHIVLCLLGTRRYRNGVVLHDAVREQQVEPVGVAILLLTQPLIAGGVGIYYLARCDKGGEFTVDTRGVGVHHIGRTHIALLGEFLIDRHLLLRVHDVEVLVVGHETHRELTGVVHIGLAGLTLLGVDDNHTSHSAGTVDGGS